MTFVAKSVVPSKGKSEMIRRLRLANLRKLLRHRNGATLPDDDAGREYLIELLLPISVGPHADIKMPNAIEVWASWMGKHEANQLIDRINRMPIWERKPTARVLGERLRVTNHERERLKLWTIAPCDMGQEGMRWWRKRKDRERQRRARQSRGAKSQSTSISRNKPWLKLGIKRSTWYSQHRWTTSSEVKLTKTQDILVQKEEVAVEELYNNSLLASETGSETALLLAGRTCQRDYSSYYPPVPSLPEKRIVVTNYDAALGLMASKGKFMSWRDRAA